MIHIGSRYQPIPVEFMLDGRTGMTRPTVLRDNQRVSGSSSVITHWSDGQRLDTIGSSLYNNSQRWWQVMDLNPDILNPLDLTPGTTLRLQ